MKQESLFNTYLKKVYNETDASPLASSEWISVKIIHDTIKMLISDIKNKINNKNCVIHDTQYNGGRGGDAETFKFYVPLTYDAFMVFAKHNKRMNNTFNTKEIWLKEYPIENWYVGFLVNIYKTLFSDEPLMYIFDYNKDTGELEILNSFDNLDFDKLEDKYGITKGEILSTFNNAEYSKDVKKDAIQILLNSGKTNDDIIKDYPYLADEFKNK